MASLFIILLILAFIHFVYEGILLPSIRCKFRYDLFRLRDELRTLKLEHTVEISHEAYSYVQDGINASLRYLHAINVVEAFRSLNRIAEDQQLHARMRHIAGVVNTCSVKRVREIDDSAIEVLAKVALLNSAGMLLYIIPLAFLLFWSASIQKRVTQFVKAVLSAPESQRGQFIPAIPS